MPNTRRPENLDDDDDDDTGHERVSAGVPARLPAVVPARQFISLYGFFFFFRSLQIITPNNTRRRRCRYLAASTTGVLNQTSGRTGNKLVLITSVPPGDARTRIVGQTRGRHRMGSPWETCRVNARGRQLGDASWYMPPLPTRVGKRLGAV